jgi:UDP-N-acetylglucosamine 2-epimerase (non-hydrolysing)
VRVMTILGTRPEIIRLSQLIPILDAHSDHCLVHTGQNFTSELSENFFGELRVRTPDVNLGVRANSFGEQAAQILSTVESLISQRKPERLLILGDTNSGLSAVVARRVGLPVFHMEAGNRCYDDRVPEEVNRRIIDHCSTVLLPYTARSKENLEREGFTGAQIHVTGNPIFEVMEAFQAEIDSSDVLMRLGVQPRKFFLVTAHRAENVDDEMRFRLLLDALRRLSAEYELPVVVSLHPRSRSRAEAHGLDLRLPGIRFESPFSFRDFVRLEKTAFCVLTDSGTVQEETCILNVPNVTIRDTTERPETLDCGSTILTGIDPDRILRAVKLVTAARPQWSPPAEYTMRGVAETVARIVLGFRLPSEAERRWQHSAALDALLASRSGSLPV